MQAISDSVKTVTLVSTKGPRRVFKFNREVYKGKDCVPKLLTAAPFCTKNNKTYKNFDSFQTRVYKYDAF